jgi:hypothetical protein
MKSLAPSHFRTAVGKLGRPDRRLGDSASKAEDDACESQLPSLQTLTWDLSRHSWSLELGRSYQPSASAIDSLVIMIDGGQQLSRRRGGHGGPLVGDREFRRSAHPIET